MTLIYKIVDAGAWAAATHAGVFYGAAVDQADGFIHFSALDQLRDTAAKHFAGKSDLVLVAVEAEALGEALKWEISRGGALFPHLYAPLLLSAVGFCEPLPLGENAVHVFSGRISC